MPAGNDQTRRREECMTIESPPVRRARRASRPSPAATAPAREPMRAFARSLPMALLRTREAVMARFRPLLRAHDLTEQQWRVLRALTASATSLRASEISQLTLLSLPSLSRLLRTLETRGLLRRVVLDRDLRAAQVTLSAAGRRLVAALAPLSEAKYAEITDAIGDADMVRLYRTLERVLERLSDDAAGGDPLGD